MNLPGIFPAAAKVLGPQILIQLTTFVDNIPDTR
jgi:hypothetical protein